MPKSGPKDSVKKNAPKTLLDSLDSLIERYHLLKHPFYQAWTEGKLSKESLQLYAAQYYQHVRAFPENLKQLASRTNGNLQTIVKENLAEEIDLSAPHPMLWREFAASLGVSDAALDCSRVLPGIAALLDTFDEVSTDGSMAQAVAMFYSYEAQVPEIATQKISGASPILRTHRFALASIFCGARRSGRAASRGLARVARGPEEYRRGCGSLCGGAQFESSLGRAGRGVSAGLRLEEAITGRVRAQHIVGLSGILIAPTDFLSSAASRPLRFFLSFSARLPAALSLLQNFYSARPAYEHLFRESEKQPVLDDADGFVQFTRYFFRICHRPERAIENIVSAVRDVRLTIDSRPQLRARSHGSELSLGRLPAKRDHFHGNRECRAQTLHQFRLVHDHRHSLTRGGDDFFAQQRAAVALDQRQSAQLHFIGAVDGQINFILVCESRQRNAQAAGLLGGALRCGDTGETQSFFRDAAAEFTYEIGGGGTGAEADDHAVLHELSGRLGSFLFPPVLFARVHRSSAAALETRRHNRRSGQRLPTTDSRHVGRGGTNTQGKMNGSSEVLAAAVTACRALTEEIMSDS